MPRSRRFRDALRTSAGLTTIWRALDQLEFTLKKNGTRQTNNAAPTSPLSGAAGARRSRSTTRGRTCLSTNGASRRICCAATGAAPAARARSITRRAGIGRRTPSWRRLRPTALTATAVFDGPIDAVSSAPMSSRSWCPTLRPGDVVVLDNLVVHKQPEVRTAIEQARRAPAVSPALQSRLQSDRDGVCQTEGLLARGATAHLRPGHGAHRRRAGDSSRPPSVATTSRHCGYRFAGPL